MRRIELYQRLRDTHGKVFKYLGQVFAVDLPQCLTLFAGPNTVGAKEINNGS